MLVFYFLHMFQYANEPHVQRSGDPDDNQGRQQNIETRQQHNEIAVLPNFLKHLILGNSSHDAPAVQIIALDVFFAEFNRPLLGIDPVKWNGSGMQI
ncbi:hypothetical protein D3C77_693860 [compost metagenome]